LPHEHSDLAPPALLNSLHGLPMRSFFLALLVATTLLWSAAQLLLQTLRALALVLAITSFLVLGPWWALVHWYERYGDEPG
jgi:hypothetical protein